MMEITKIDGSDSMSLKEHIRMYGLNDLKCFNGENFYAMELATHESLISLSDSKDVVLDYHWYEAEDVRENSSV